MKKTIKLLIFIAVMILTLTGCVSVDYEVTINKDGTGKISYVYGYEKEFLKSMGYTGDEMSSEIKTDAEEKGYTVEAYSDETKEGIKISKNVEDITQEILIEDLFEGYVQDSENSNIKKEGKKFSQNAVIDLSQMEGMESYVSISYTVNLPSRVASNNANEVSKDGKTLTWNLKPGEKNEIRFETGLSKNLIWLIIAIIAILVIIVVIILFIFKKKTTKKEEKEQENKQIKE